MDVKLGIEDALRKRGVQAVWVKREEERLTFPHAACLLHHVIHTSKIKYLLFYPEDRMVFLEQLESLLGEGGGVLWPDTTHRAQEHYFFPSDDIFSHYTVWVPEELSQMSTIYLITSLNEWCLKLTPDAFLKLFPKQEIKKFTGLIPAEILTSSSVSEENVNSLFPERLRQRLSQVNDLPAFPEIGRRILELRANPDAGVRDLSSVIAQDPALAAQVMSWSLSPYYGYPGQLHSLDEAIIKVLGYDRALNLALGVVLGKAFQIKSNGPLGARSYWRSALYTALAAESLVMYMQIKPKGGSKGIIYLCGLLHNIGYLVFAHLMPSLFDRLNQTMSFNMHVPIRVVEHHLFGVTHDQIGAWLLTRWRLPDMVIAAVQDHHRIYYGDPICFYSNLILVASRLVAQLGIGDGSLEPLPKRLLGFLGLTPDALSVVLAKIKTNQLALDDLCSNLTSGH